MKRTIYIWPDGWWCAAEELSHFSYRSDDYEVHSVPEDFTDEECDALAHERTAYPTPIKDTTP